MKTKFFFLLLIICVCAYQLHAQNIKLKLINNSNEPIQLVNCIDSLKGVLQSSDSLGEMVLNTDNYDLMFTHVSFNPVTLHIKKESGDTTIKVVLEIKTMLSNEVIVTSGKKSTPKNKHEAGRFYENSRNTLSFQTKARFGILIDEYEKDGDYKIENIKFRLNNPAKNRKESFILEIALYEVENGFISPQPINNKPIYVYSSELKIKNIIKINQNIILPREGLFVLFSIPLLNKVSKSTVTFPMLVNAKKCELFDIRGKDLRMAQSLILDMHCKYDNFFQSYKSIPVGITYYK